MIYVTIFICGYSNINTAHHIQYDTMILWIQIRMGAAESMPLLLHSLSPLHTLSLCSWL